MSFQGADIPDVEQVIQFGVPTSLSVWIQRAGRAGRSANVHARAILLVEKSMFEKQKKRTGKGLSASLNPLDEIHDDSSDTDSDKTDDEDLLAGVADLPGVGLVEHEWKKKVEDALRLWIETTKCRREVTDTYFNNPPRRSKPCLNLSLTISLIYWHA